MGWAHDVEFIVFDWRTIVWQVRVIVIVRLVLDTALIVD
jgi:hypothetical protein